MEAQATAKYIHMSPRKTRLLVNLIRGLSIDEARRQLLFSKKLAAKPTLKVLNSAIANAKNNLGANVDDFKVVTAYVDEGPTIHRFKPRAHGRAFAIRKRMSHITIAVGDGKGIEVKVEKPKIEIKKAPKKTAKKTVEKKEVEKATKKLKVESKKLKAKS